MGNTGLPLEAMGNVGLSLKVMGNVGLSSEVTGNMFDPVGVLRCFESFFGWVRPIIKHRGEFVPTEF